MSVMNEIRQVRAGNAKSVNWETYLAAWTALRQSMRHHHYRHLLASEAAKAATDPAQVAVFRRFSVTRLAARNRAYARLAALSRRFWMVNTFGVNNADVMRLMRERCITHYAPDRPGGWFSID